VEEVVGEGVGEEAGLAWGEAGEGDGRRGGVGVEVVEPEAEGGGIALEAALTAGLATDEAGDDFLNGGGVEKEDEGPELGRVSAVLEGVEVALGGTGAGSFAAPPTGLTGSEHGWSLLSGVGYGLIVG
jgi:hypothetical protein